MCNTSPVLQLPISHVPEDYISLSTPPLPRLQLNSANHVVHLHTCQQAPLYYV